MWIHFISSKKIYKNKKTFQEKQQKVRNRYINATYFQKSEENQGKFADQVISKGKYIKANY